MVFTTPYNIVDTWFVGQILDRCGGGAVDLLPGLYDA
jgi:hypothetical protein